MVDVKAVFTTVSIINREQVVFDVLGGNYRLVVAIKFRPRSCSSSSSGRMPNRTGSIPLPSVVLSATAMSRDIEPIQTMPTTRHSRRPRGSGEPRPARLSATASRSLAMLVDDQSRR